MTNIVLSAGARSALLALYTINNQLSSVQQQLATGLRVNNPTDDPIAYFAAAALNQQATQLNSLTNGFNIGTGAVGAANSGITAIQSLVSQAQTIANEALESTASPVVTVTGTLSGLTTGSVIATTGGAANRFKAGDTVTVNDGTTIATYTAANNDTVQTFLNAINNTSGIKVTASLNASGDILLTANSANVNVTVGGTETGTGTFSSVLGLTAGTTNFVVNTTRQSLATQYNNILTQINTAAQDATFDGVNLLTGSTYTLNVDANGNTLALSGGGGTATATGLALSTATNQWQGNTDVNNALTAMSNALTTLQTMSTSLGSQSAMASAWQTFSKSLMSTLQTGATNLTAADTNTDSALANALETQQQFAASALAITANSSLGALRLLSSTTG
jgi:flagellin-like hook-associated protein FlgL